MSIWDRIKNILKRFFPLTIHRFNQEVWSVRDGLRKADKQQMEAMQASEAGLIHTLNGMQAELAVLKRSCAEENDWARRSLEMQGSVQHSIDILSTQLTALQNELDQLTQSVGALEGVKGVIHWRSDRLEHCMIHCIPRAELSFEVALAEHCDLNCVGCDHFSPLAEPEFADLEKTARDFARLSELFHGHAKEIHLLGGEPLLNPNITSFLKMARDCFPDAIIDVTTNGLRLLNQPQEFWQSCHDNNIVICPTKYPIPLDFEEMERRAAEYGVQYRYFGRSGTVVKTSHLYRMDVEGRQDGSRNFLLCHRANTCVYLQQGRLYTCTVAPTVRHFNKYFETELKVLPEDSIDIYKTDSAKEIMEFLAKPIPFCRYCMADKARQNQPWRQSEKVIGEWT